MTALVLAVLAGYGVFLVFTSIAFGWRGFGAGPALSRQPAHRRRAVSRWLAQAGLSEVSGRDLLVAECALSALGAVGAFALFGGLLPAVVAGAFAASFPATAYRQRRRARVAAAQEAWPRLIDEIRILTSAVGHSIPQALFEAGADAPPALRDAFDTAHREWLISTDFARTLSVLKERLADPTADAACETLLIAHDIGGTDLDRRLEDLAADRRSELQYRKDAVARQAGVRFARRFVLVVPLGMALAGLSVGTGRAAYTTPTGQLLVAAALVMVAVCWFWAGHFLRLPNADRVFDR